MNLWALSLCVFCLPRSEHSPGGFTGQCLHMLLWICWHHCWLRRYGFLLQHRSTLQTASEPSPPPCRALPHTHTLAHTRHQAPCAWITARTCNLPLATKAPRTHTQRWPGLYSTLYTPTHSHTPRANTGWIVRLFHSKQNSKKHSVVLLYLALPRAMNSS